jgi:zinc transport system substrate-binding protein
VLALALLSSPFALVAAEPLSVFVSVLPQKYFVERVGGERVRVTVMVGPGQSPATYEPKPKQMTTLAHAQLYFRIGVPFENVWMDRIAAANPNMMVVDLGEGVRLRAMATHGHSRKPRGEHEHATVHRMRVPAPGRYDPHVWTAPLLVKVMVRRIADALNELDPSHWAYYEANQARFSADLDRLDEDIRRVLADKRSRRFMVFHPSWGYFADAYDLQQIPIEILGKEPGAKRLAQIIDEANKADVRIIFVQQQFRRRDAQTVARAIGGKVIAVDPLAENYIDNLRLVAETFAEAMD